jgi:Kef-type K+ transport system membrane component KefB
MHIAALVFIDIAIIMIVARVFGRAARAVGQPAVVGEIIAGIALGPSLLAAAVAGPHQRRRRHRRRRPASCPAVRRRG